MLSCFLSHIFQPLKGECGVHTLKRGLNFMAIPSVGASSSHVHAEKAVSREGSQSSFKPRLDFVQGPSSRDFSTRHVEVLPTHRDSSHRFEDRAQAPRKAPLEFTHTSSRSDARPAESSAHKTEDLRDRITSKRKREEEDESSSKRERSDERGSFTSHSSQRHDHREPERRDRREEYQPRFQEAPRSFERSYPPAQVRPKAPMRDDADLIRNPETIRSDHSITIQSRPEAPYMTYLRTGEKTAECRINIPMYQKIREGDIILFHNRQDGIFCKVTFLHTYRTFKDMIQAEGVTNLLPQLKRLNKSDAELMPQAIRTYEGFPGSQNISRYGSVAIGVKYLCDKPQQRR